MQANLRGRTLDVDASTLILASCCTAQVSAPPPGSDCNTLAPLAQILGHKGRRSHSHNRTA